jgi:hypothetical protein
MKALDPDNDGTVSLAEAQAAGATKFAALDSDSDGTLDAKEAKGVLKVSAAAPTRMERNTGPDRSGV